MQLNYTCNNCSKTYKRYNYYLKHQLECKCLDNLMCEPVDREKIKYPSTIQQTLEFLISSNENLKNQLKKIQSEKNNEKQKIGIIPWLTKNYQPKLNFSDYNICLTHNHLMMLNDDKINIFLKNVLIEKFTNKDFIKSLDIKSNKIYIFENEWICLTPNKICLLISNINKQLTDNLLEWQTNLGDKIYNDNISNIYLRILKKINKINIHNTTIITQINQCLYEVAKIKIKLIEYEIVPI